MFDVLAIGELLIDFTPVGKGENQNPVFEMNPGGAPANCLAALSSLGGKTAFIGKVGSDKFGNFLIQSLQEAGVHISGIKKTDLSPTTLAFVHLSKQGDRDFSFIRKPGADILLMVDDIELSLVDNSKVVHFGSLSFTDEPSREAVLYTIKYARQKGKLISYDPNYRPLLWESEAEAKKWMNIGLELAHIVKLSDEESHIITGYDDAEKGGKEILKLGEKKVFVTMGEKGAFYMDKNQKGFLPAYKVKSTDTTGCGDAFMGAILYKMTHRNNDSLRQMTQFANAVGAICSTKKGGIPAMPNMNAVKSFNGKENAQIETT